MDSKNDRLISSGDVSVFIWRKHEEESNETWMIERRISSNRALIIKNDCLEGAFLSPTNELLFEQRKSSKDGNLRLPFHDDIIKSSKRKPRDEVNSGVQFQYRVPKNTKLAVYYDEQLANQGNAFAQNNFGVCMEAGLGVKQDLKKAIQYYQKASLQGHLNAKRNLQRSFNIYPNLFDEVK